MILNWENKDPFEVTYLVGDIGGTNSNFAIVGEDAKGFHLVLKADFPSNSIENVLDPLRRLFKELEDSQYPKPNKCCLSVAGPVDNNRCQPTNLEWEVDGDAIEKQFNIPTVIINDFLAISYALPVLKTDDPTQVTPLAHTDDSLPKPHGNVSMVIGAGTGLGVGFVVESEGKFTAYPSEGGHASFAAFDTESKDLKEYITEKNLYASEIELIVSGKGIANIFQYFIDIRKVIIDQTLEDILATPFEDRAAIISKNASKHPVCQDVMRLFVKIYGRITADLSTTLLPTNGIYLAGGIVSKNEDIFTAGKHFMYFFEMNFRTNIQDILKTLPVYIIKDYNVSLYGAANAAKQLG